MKLLKVEFKKLKNSKIFLVMALLPLISILYGCINYYANIEILKKEWISLWTQVYLFYGMFFFPCLSAIFSAYVWNGEHKHDNFKLLLTAPVSKMKIILTKMTLVFLLNIVTQIYFVLLFLIAGNIFKFKAEFPINILYWLFIAVLFSIANISLQNFLSLKIKSFAIPVGIALVIAVGSMFVATLEKLGFLQYIFSSTSITLAMNHYPEIMYNVKDFIIMRTYTLIIAFLFTLLQKIELNRKIN